MTSFFRSRWLWGLMAWGAPLILLVLVADFATHAVGRGVDVLGRFEASARLFHGLSDPGTWAIYGHMVAGGLATLCLPLQLIAPVRRNWPVLHRWLGRGLVVAAGAAGLGGLTYIALHGTIGGPVMSAGFAGYGGLMVWAAAQTWRHGRRRSPHHRIWAVRLALLILGSWIYRLHYGLWYGFAGGVYSNTADFSGLFDQVQTVAFYLPYLALVEVWVRRTLRRG